MTLAAVDAIKQAQVVAFPAVSDGAESMAASIAKPWIRPEQRRLPLVFPMVEASEPRRQAWHQAAAALAAEVVCGHAVVMLCEGDASLFATSSYVVLALQQRFPRCPLRVIPGITAMSAAAAVGAWPLALQQDQLLVMPCPDHPEDLITTLADAARQERVLALLKLGRRWSWVRPLLERQGLLKDTLFAERVGWSDQKVCRADQLLAGQRPYFSLLLIRQTWPRVMP